MELNVNDDVVKDEREGEVKNRLRCTVELIEIFEEERARNKMGTCMW